MTRFTKTGDKPHDLWLFDNSPDFGILPANTIQGIDFDRPIWLKIRNASYGETHISTRHGHWVKTLSKDIPELVYLKLGQPGMMHCTEKGSKIKVNLSVHPSALIVLDYIEHAETPHFSVTTMYQHGGVLDGDRIGRYKGRR